MGLFDVIDDITEKQVMKTDTGDNRIFGVVVGQVAKNYDKDMPGRVCVTVPTRDKDANELKWARVAMPSSGSKWGHYFLPEVGDQVLLVFEQGNIEKPYVRTRRISLKRLSPKMETPFILKTTRKARATRTKSRWLLPKRRTGSNLTMRSM